MRAVGIKGGKGNADAFFIEDNVPDPAAKAGYVVVGIKAFGLNRMDIMQREDRYPYPLLPESGKILGVEFSGTVLEKGPECMDHGSCSALVLTDQQVVPHSRKGIESLGSHMVELYDPSSCSKNSTDWTPSVCPKDCYLRENAYAYAL